MRELKGVQDVLGAFQDCEVQKASLEGFGREMIVERGASQAPALLAMGALVDDLDEREQQARDEFVDHFARFDAQGRPPPVPPPVRSPARPGRRGMMRA